MSDDTVTIEIDGQSLSVAKGSMLIKAADDAGIDIPRFCYHKKLSVAANCRMCLVEVERAPKPMPACATPVMDGMKVFTKSKLAVEAQRGVMEFLLINHPLDCPICDQGGECELQDLAMGFGKGISRFSERKRVVADKNVGPLIATEMTRCIHCTRCVRFGVEVAGMPELGATGRGENLQIGTFIERSIDSELSGNVIDVCPVGALTSKPYRFGARAWEMTARASVAPHDGVGSNIFAHVLRGKLRRVVPKDNEGLNECWISDRDRFSYEGIYAEDRLQRPRIKTDGQWRDVEWADALEHVASELKAIIAEKGADAIGALASPMSTNEELSLFQQLFRALGVRNIDSRLQTTDFSDEDALGVAPSLGTTLSALEAANSVLVIGGNVRKDQPMVNHRLRKAALAGGQIHRLVARDYDANMPLGESLVSAPGNWVAELSGVCKALCEDARNGVSDAAKQVASLLNDVTVSETARRVADSLKGAERGAVLLGVTAIRHPEAATLRALGATIAELGGASFGELTPGGNAAGAALAGVLPHRGPRGEALDARGSDTHQQAESKLDGYALLNVEPDLDCMDAQAWAEALEGARFVVSMLPWTSEAIDRYATVQLPIATFAETPGSFVNLLGEVQVFDNVIAPLHDSRPAWRVLRVLGNVLELDGFDYQSVDAVRAMFDTDARGANGKGEPGFAVPASIDAGDGEALWRCAETPIYAVDGLVRRANALQQTNDASFPTICVNQETATRFGLNGSGRARIAQDGREAVLPYEIDDAVAGNCVMLASGVASTSSLGGYLGPVTLKAES